MPPAVNDEHAAMPRDERGRYEAFHRNARRLPGHLVQIQMRLHWKLPTAELTQNVAIEAGHMGFDVLLGVGDVEGEIA